MIDIKQSTIEEIIDSEELLAIAAPSGTDVYFMLATYNFFQQVSYINRSGIRLLLVSMLM